jgi:hypothetical protein
MTSKISANHDAFRQALRELRQQYDIATLVVILVERDEEAGLGVALSSEIDLSTDDVRTIIQCGLAGVSDEHREVRIVGPVAKA